MLRNKPTDEQLNHIKSLNKFEGELVYDEQYGIMGIVRFIFTHGIIGLCDSFGYKVRWCYKTKLEAELALRDYLEGVTPDEPKGYTRRL